MTLESSQQFIQCPKCEARIDVQGVLYRQIQADLQKEFQDELADQRRVFELRESSLNKRQKALEEEKRGLQDSVEEGVRKKISEEKKRIETQLRKRFEDENSEQISSMQKELSEKSTQVKQLHRAQSDVERLKREKEELKDTLKAEAEKELSVKLSEEKKRIETQVRKRLEDDTSEQLASMRKELSEKSEQVKQLHRAQSDVERLKREKEELKDTIEADAQKKITDTVRAEKEKIQKTLEDRALLKLSEKDHVIDQLKNQLQEAQRKAEQGSMQIQGEVQELAIENWLRSAFPLDSVNEIKKGARGADCLHVVNTPTRPNCGSIYYESKRAKEFAPRWIEKFKDDLREKGADLGVIVTETMPRDMERMGLREGVWICNFEEFKGLCAVLRETVVRVSRVTAAQEDKGEKTLMLYHFLTSNEFKMQVEAIVEGFTQMQTDLLSEKRAMQGIWKKREKQIEKVLLNTTNMHSAIKGIAGNAIPSVPQLELPFEEEPNE